MVRGVCFREDDILPYGGWGCLFIRSRGDGAERTFAHSPSPATRELPPGRSLWAEGTRSVRSRRGWCGAFVRREDDILPYDGWGTNVAVGIVRGVDFWTTNAFRVANMQSPLRRRDKNIRNGYRINVRLYAMYAHTTAIGKTSPKTLPLCDLFQSLFLL